MNKKRPTPNRVGWTSEALNHFMKVHSDVDNLKITKEEREKGYAAGVLKSADIIYRAIKKRVGIHHDHHREEQPYKANFWYVGEATTTEKEIPSDLLEEGFTQVPDWYLRHQNTWDDADKVEEFVEEEDNNDSDESDDSDDEIALDLDDI
jgi:hypothetical protein